MHARFEKALKPANLIMSAVKFSVLNLTPNLKDEVVKFKKANPALFPPNSPLFFKKLCRLSKFTGKFDESELVLLRSHLLGGRYFW